MLPKIDASCAVYDKKQDVWRPADKCADGNDDPKIVTCCFNQIGTFVLINSDFFIPFRQEIKELKQAMTVRRPFIAQITTRFGMGSVVVIIINVVILTNLVVAFCVDRRNKATQLLKE